MGVIVPHVETRRVGANGAHPHSDHIDRGAQLVDTAAGRLARHPAPARHGHPTVERDRELQDHVRPPLRDPRPPRLVLPPSLGQVEELDVDPGRA